MSVDEVYVAANGFVEEREDAPARMLRGHRVEHGGEVLHEVEDHGRDSGLSWSLRFGLAFARLSSSVKTYT